MRALDIVEGKSGVLAAHGHKPVERAAVEQVPAELARHAARNRPLAGAAGTIDGNHRYLTHPASSSRRPASRAVDTNPGNEVATFCTSRIAIGERARAQYGEVTDDAGSKRPARRPVRHDEKAVRQAINRTLIDSAVCHGARRSLFSPEVRRRRSRPYRPRQRPPRQEDRQLIQGDRPERRRHDDSRNGSPDFDIGAWLARLNRERAAECRHP